MTVTVKDYDVSFEFTPGHLWEELQDRMSTIHDRFTQWHGKFTRISRDDGGCNYSATGSYSVTYTHPTIGEYSYSVEVTD